MLFDGSQFAHAWLATSVAAGEDPERPSLYRSTLVEIYEGRGARLIASDSVIFVRTWVPEASAGRWDPEPELDDSPDSEIVLSDKWARAKGLLNHIVKLTKGEDPEVPEATIRLDVASAEAVEVGQLPGMETRWATLSYPGEESVKLHVPEGTWTNWRALVTNHSLRSTRSWVMDPDLLGRLGKLGRMIPGCVVSFSFGGVDGAALFEARNDDVEISGLVMPIAVAEKSAEGVA